MSTAVSTISEQAPTPEKTLRRLFLMLFLRGRGARGLRRQTAPKSIGQRLGLTLLVYAGVGMMALFFVRQSVFALAVYLHAMTFVFLGMFVASSAGEVLFNKQEADILSHRPISSRALLWAKVRVLIEVSLWLACAFNLGGFFIGLTSFDGNWSFPIVHAASTVLEALFCTGCVVMIYQLCLRWFGREKLDGLMTTAQVLLSVLAALSGQLLPQLVLRFDRVVGLTAKTWWIALLPPAWFAGIDDALSGTMARSSWLLAGVAVVATAAVLGLAFGKLAIDYQAGLQTMEESAPRRAPRAGHRRLLDRLVDLPPLSWCLRDPVARASFLLTAAYLSRDRDVKLRVYPALAPYLVMPVLFLFGAKSSKMGGFGAGFGVAFIAAYIGIIPMMALSLLQFSQQWQASDIFRCAPTAGPSSLCSGARVAVFCFLTLPAAVVFTLIVWLAHRHSDVVLLLIPGMIALPIYALLPNWGGRAVPLSTPVDAAKSAGRGLSMVGGMIGSMALSGLAFFAWSIGWFWWFVFGELIAAVGVYVGLRRSIANVRWVPLE